MEDTIHLYLDLVGYKVVKIEDIKLTHNINKHSKMYLKAILCEEEQTPIFNTQVGSQIELSHNDESNNDGQALEVDKIIFKGMVQTITIKNEKNVFTLEILAISNSFQLDVKKNCKSFQDSNLTYREVIEAIIQKYNGSDFGYTLENKSIEKFTMQYEETDWEFLIRMASRFNQGLVSDVTFGIPIGEFKGDIKGYNNYVKKDIEDFMISSQNTNENLKEIDTIRFCIITSEKFNIGDYVNFQDTELFVKSIEGQMENGVILYNYELCSEYGLSQDKIYNEKITGLALKGVVLRSIKDTVKVKLEIDESQDESTAWRFLYQTMYTAEGNSGWYCMPEVNDTVFIYFKDKEESNAVSLNSIRELGYSSDKINDQHTKYFRTEICT